MCNLLRDCHSFDQINGPKARFLHVLLLKFLAVWLTEVASRLDVDQPEASTGVVWCGVAAGPVANVGEESLPAADVSTWPGLQPLTPEETVERMK
ncbi:hypothetical protein StoSoilA2_44200 [Arthrobacter sp. StoSoilA2]|nr:hypothetical protein StoSoilA2_44200 [Arthrobacter sp. StoSoilA2]BCW50373.1 hypothetical protein StoSoilB13_27150 [Arthrobacter sp. StoSoilB13]